MEVNLSPQMAEQKLFDGEGGSYYSWSPSSFPVLAAALVCGGRLTLQPRGFAMPHYSDCFKIGYVIQGSCTVGLVSPNSPEEKVLRIEKGYGIPVPMGGLSWWFNGGDTDFVVVFLGETSKAHIPGTITYFLMTGAIAMLGGFTSEFISRAYGLSEDEASKLVKSQTSPLIFKLKEGTAMPQPSMDSVGGLAFNFGSALPDVDVNNGGLLTALTASGLPLLKRIGLSASLVKLDPNAMLSPMYSTDASVQITYVVKGSGKIQIVGINGEQTLDAKLKAGHLVVVPKFFAAAILADGEGIELYSVVTSPQPVFGHLAGNTSIWKALSPGVVQTSLNVTPQFEQLFISKNTKNTIIIPPKN